MSQHKRLIAIMLALIVLELLGGFIPAYSQTACHFSFFNPTHPDYTPAGQPFEVTTRVTVVCGGAADALEEIRVDLMDAHDQTILSRKTYTTPTMGSITTTIVNDVTAPMDTGTWVLQTNAYVIGRPSGTTLASNQLLFSVQVTPYTPPTTTTSSTTITPITITTRPAATSTSQQLVMPTQTLTTHTENRIQDNSTYYPIAILLGVMAVAIGIITMRRKKRKMKERTQIY